MDKEERQFQRQKRILLRMIDEMNSKDKLILQTMIEEESWW